MVLRTERTKNTNTGSTISPGISVGSSTSVTLASANPDRMTLTINVQDRDIWVKEQEASVDNDKKGILVHRNGTYEMQNDNVYTGEVSGIAESGTAEVFVTEK